MTTRVLVVDDDVGILETIEGVLELEGYEVELARDGVEAIQKVSAHPPALLLLDIMMPQMDGFAVAAELQRQGWHPAIPIIVLTADGRAAAKAAQIGAQGYVQKPFALETFIKEVTRVVGP
jgi:CheY-like chemotaxis protein